MTTTKKKRIYTGRQTNLFYALMAQLPGYDRQYADLIKEGIVDDFLTRLYGPHHKRPASLSRLSDAEYSELLADLQGQVGSGKSIARLQTEAVRRAMVNKILKAFSRIGVTVVGGDYTTVNYHIRRLPISKGRIIPQFRFDELEKLLGAVRAYCDNLLKQQRKEQASAERN